METTTITIDEPGLGKILIDIYNDGNIWLTHPVTRVRVGLGQLENEERQAFVHVNTELMSVPERDGVPVLSVALNDCDLYDVELSGPTEESVYHRGSTEPTHYSTGNPLGLDEED